MVKICSLVIIFFFSLNLNFKDSKRNIIFTTFADYTIYANLKDCNMNKLMYLMPELQVVEMEAESGFVLSNMEDPIEKPEQEW